MYVISEMLLRHYYGQQELGRIVYLATVLLTDQRIALQELVTRQQELG